MGDKGSLNGCIAVIELITHDISYKLKARIVIALNQFQELVTNRIWMHVLLRDGVWMKDFQNSVAFWRHCKIIHERPYVSSCLILFIFG